MNALLQELAAQIDVLESKRTHGFPWKNLLDQIVMEIDAVNSEAVSVENSGNPLFRILGRRLPTNEGTRRSLAGRCQPFLNELQLVLLQ